MNTAAPCNYPMATIHVGNLAPDVNEAVLFEKFSATGSVVSIRVCRDLATRRSLGYAYVNFQQSADAERALDTMNFVPIKGRPCRIMVCQRDRSLRRSGVGNIFIKNLDKNIDAKALYDTFSAFGNILSCKIALEENEISKGFGYVHFKTQEAADQAVEKVNGMLLNDQKVFVGKWMSRKERVEQLGDAPRKFTNVYVKNFGEDFEDEDMKKLFEAYGEIQSMKIMRTEDGKSRGFGFVSFAEPDSASQAVEAIDEKELNGNVLFCGRAAKKSERQAELLHRFQQQKMERINQFQGVNLHIKNLEETIDDTRLRKGFESYGTITSVKVMRDDKGNSKGFGFVCFQSPEEATKAVTEKNGQIVMTKPLYVALAQPKEERQAQLAAQHMQRVSAGMMPQGTQPVGQMFTGGFYPAMATFPPGLRRSMFSPQVVQTRFPTCVKVSKIQLFGKKVPSSIPARILDTLSKAKNSVGLIWCGDTTFGTCFLLADVNGRMTMMTCFHVIESIYDKRSSSTDRRRYAKIFVRFDDDYSAEGHSNCVAEVDERLGEIYCNAYLDYAVMYLKDSAAIAHLPGLSYIVRSSPRYSDVVTLIGYPENRRKSVEICRTIPSYNWLATLRQRASEALRYCQQNPQECLISSGQDVPCAHSHIGDIQSDNPPSTKIPYDTSFFHGSSGSPVFNDDGHIVAMHTRGYPYVQRSTKYSLMEFGTTLGAIYQDIREKYGNETYDSLFSNT